MHNILMLGAQGSGKGTQAERLSAKLAIPTVSIGHLFRTEIDKGTGLGQMIQDFMNRGDRVPSSTVNQLMRGRLEEADVSNGVILDGYPRTIHQMENLDQIFTANGRALTNVIYINVSDEESLRRLSGRWVCSNTKCEENYHEKYNPPKKEAGRCDTCGSELVQRSDDKPEAIAHRLELYHKDTQPLIDHYRTRGVLIEVNGEQSIDKVEEDINRSLGI